MKIQCFIFTWNQFVKNAIDLENRLNKFGKTIVINSNVNEKKDHWINLNDGYFAEQWNTLVSNIDSDTDFIFNTLADVNVDDFDTIFSRFNYFSAKYDIGIYAPNVDYTYHKYNINLLNLLEDNVYEVPNTDCLCWFVNKDVVKNNLIFDINTNFYGYGVDWYYSAECVLQNKYILRDYNIKVTHPSHKNYDGDKANKCFDVWFQEQPITIRDTITDLFKKHKSYLIG